MTEADLLRENAELRASNANLREALESACAHRGLWLHDTECFSMDGSQPCVCGRESVMKKAKDAIAETPAASLAAITAPLEAKIAEMQGVLELAEPYCCGTALMLIRKLLNAKGINAIAGEEIESPAKLLEDHEKAHAIFVRYSARTVRALESENQSLKNRLALSLAAIQHAARETKAPHLGNHILTRGLWWCECGRGLGENINLFDIHERFGYCPSCGAAVDWESVGLGDTEHGNQGNGGESKQ
jgi:hypothetical protein